MRTLVLTSLLFGFALAQAHPKHESVTQVEPTLDNWSMVLARFQRHGDGNDLHLAQQIADHPLFTHQEDAQVRYLKARTFQAAHRFDEALLELEVFLQTVPHHLGGRLLEASILLVQGQYHRARRACSQIRQAPLPVALACHAQAARTPSMGTYQKIALLAQDTTGLSAPVRAWMQAIAGDIAVELGREDLAELSYRTAMQTDTSVRAQSALVDVLIRQDRFADVLVELTQARSFGLQIKRLIALKGVGQLSAEAVHSLERQVQSMYESRDFTHGREMAEYFLDVSDEPQRALTVLRAYLASQQEPEDWRLLERAKQANDKPMFRSPVFD